MTLTPGTRLGPYEILSVLGTGGMGEVYLASDSRLKRRIALKLLPAAFIRDPTRVRRFEQESQAASSLNHPNIITIHEIGQHDGLYYIVTEYIEGRTLRQRIGARMDVSEALGVAVQVARALEAAHAAGIVHRDIKPENIMLRPDGLVKVVDFGLAKLAEASPGLTGSETTAPTGISRTTEPGTVMGTVSYMSPEQARGESVDARTDIFSLGLVTFELLTGRTPFDGPTPNEMIASILRAEPAALSDLLPGAPANLERVLAKTLRKDRKDRYQTTEELRLDFEAVKQDLEFESRPTRRTGKTIARDTRAAGASYRRGLALTLGALLVAGGGLGLWLYRSPGASPPPVPSPALKIARLTATGKTSRAAISPDGRYVVYVEDDGDLQSLWVTQVTASSNVQIVAPADAEYRSLNFSHDGNFIYYVRWDKVHPRGALYKSPVLGGTERKLIVDVTYPITLSPDGSQVAFIRQAASQREQALIVAKADGTDEKTLIVRKAPQLFGPGGLAWSPDGKLIASGSQTFLGGDSYNVVGIRVADGVEQPIATHRWEGGSNLRLAWLADNSGLLVLAAEQAGRLPQIWYVTWPGGEVRAVTNDLSAYRTISLTADSATIAAVKSERVINLWIAPTGQASSARKITSGADREDGSRGISWTPDGRIVYYSEAGGNQNIWSIGADGTGNKQLSAPARRNREPAVSSDGRHIFWVSNRDQNNVWRMDIDGGNAKRVTNGGADYFPQIMPDGQWVVYEGRSPGGYLWKVPLEGGERIQLTDRPATAPVLSPDGESVAFYYRTEARISVISSSGGPPIASFPMPFQDPVQWTPDSRAIAFIRTIDGVSNLWAQPLAGGEPKPLTDFREQRIFNFAWSRDGKQLALARGLINSDVVLITGFR